MSCACKSEKEYSECCQPYLDGKKHPATAEQLMRSRYTAYTQANMTYLKSTLSHEALEEFDEAASRGWAQSSDWQGLKIVSTTKGKASDSEGIVEFIASYEKDGELVKHHEVSSFKKNKAGHWLFVDGYDPENIQETYVREEPKVGRNEPCPCGSGKKYKKCCALN